MPKNENKSSVLYRVVQESTDLAEEKKELRLRKGVAKVNSSREGHQGSSTSNSINIACRFQCPSYVLIGLFQRTMFISTKERLSMSYVTFFKKSEKLFTHPFQNILYSNAMEFEILRLLKNS